MQNANFEGYIIIMWRFLLGNNKFSLIPLLQFRKIPYQLFSNVSLFVLNKLNKNRYNLSESDQNY